MSNKVDGKYLQTHSLGFSIDYAKFKQKKENKNERKFNYECRVCT